uniref:7TM_GPCR_Srx domain-containing protein n=1 Tax=Meloidogyne floridensis TaxID=298350 RepID=A0A915PGN1_9BILA
MMPVIPYSIFFLTLDRIFSVQLLNGYIERNKIMLLFACVLTILAIFFINFYAFLRILPLPAETAFISTKLFGGVMIIIFGAYFFYCLRKRAKAISTNIQSNIARNQLNKVEPDTLVKLMLCTEIGLNFIIEHQIASIIGPINHFLNCFDALISVLTYRHTLRRFIGIDITVTTQSHVNLHQGPVRYKLTPKNSTENQIVNIQNPRTTTGYNTRIYPTNAF